LENINIKTMLRELPVSFAPVVLFSNPNQMVHYLNRPEFPKLVRCAPKANIKTKTRIC
jgi:hypothetical protein